MGDILNKLWASKGTMAIILWIAVFAYAYNMDHIKKPKIESKLIGRTLEEIMATPVDSIQSTEWDKDFKSAVTLEDK
jgi:hypothetical protein